MKKTIFITIVLLLFSFIISSFIEKKETEVDSKEERGIFISYIELSNYLKSKDKESGTKAIEEMVSNVSQLGFNLIILQVRAFSDAIYSSSEDDAADGYHYNSDGSFDDNDEDDFFER